MGLDGQINGGWVWVVGYGSGWIEMVMDGSVVVGESVGDGRIGGGGFCCAKSVVGGPAYEWVPKDGSAVGGWVGNESGWVCGMRWADGWWRLWIDFEGFFFFFIIIIF